MHLLAQILNIVAIFQFSGDGFNAVEFFALITNISSHKPKEQKI